MIVLVVSGIDAYAGLQPLIKGNLNGIIVNISVYGQPWQRFALSERFLVTCLKKRWD